MTFTSRQFKPGEIINGLVFYKYRNGTPTFVTEEGFLRLRISEVITQAKKRCRKSGLPVHVDINYLVSIFPSDGLCPIFKTPMKFGGGIEERDNSPSLDRIDNTQGYVEGNLVWISDKANRIKRDASIHELKRICEFYTGLIDG